MVLEINPLGLDELYRHVAILLFKLNQNQSWGVKKNDLLELITIHKLSNNDTELESRIHPKVKSELGTENSELEAYKVSLVPMAETLEVTKSTVPVNKRKREKSGSVHISRRSKRLRKGGATRFQQNEKSKEDMPPSSEKEQHNCESTMGAHDAHKEVDFRENSPASNASATCVEESPTPKQELTPEANSDGESDTSGLPEIDPPQVTGNLTKSCITFNESKIQEMTGKRVNGKDGNAQAFSDVAKKVTKKVTRPKVNPDYIPLMPAQSTNKSSEVKKPIEKERKTNDDPDYCPLKPFNPANVSITIKKPSKASGKRGGRPRKHPMVRKGDVWQCSVVNDCPFSSKHHSVMYRHIKKFHLTCDHSCDHCPMKFKTKRDLNFHCDRFHNDGSGKYVCPICSQSFILELSLKQHRHSAHQKKKVEMVTTPFKCRFCADILPNVIERQRHEMQLHKEQIFHCGICSYPCCNDQSLVHHLKKKHKGLTVISCEMCTREYAKTESFEFHQDEYHEDKDFGVQKTFICEDPSCQKRFRKESFLVLHGKFHLSQRRKAETFAKKSKEVRSTPSGELSPCSACGLLFSQSMMKDHLRSHAKISKCVDCGKQYRNPARLKEHRLAVHMNWKMTCPIQSCGRIFTKRSNLKKHIQTIHTEREPYQCNQCEKTFAFKGDLQVHIKGAHEGKKAPCSICGKEFLRSSERNRHERDTHGQVKQQNMD